MPLLGTLIKTAYTLRNKPVEIKKNKLNPIKAQQKELIKLLSKAQYTSFAKTYDFQSILQSSDPCREFAKQVPVFDYNKMYKEWWHRSLEGELDVSWPGKIKYFALSSGTSESSSKYIPISSDILRSIRKAGVKQIVSSVNYNLPRDFFSKGMLMIGGSTDLQHKGTYYAGDLSGITASKIPFWFRYFYKPEKKIARETDWPLKLKEIVKKAPEWDVGVLVGVPAWIQIILEKIIETYELESIHDIWPNLAVYSHSGVAISPYEKKIRRLFGKRVIFQESYLASEGYVAYEANALENHGMQMILQNGIYFEFVPFNDTNFDEDGDMRANPEVLNLEEVHEGIDYALLMTTNAGAWRYLLGDVIKFLNIADASITITGRTKHYMSITGEHLSIENMTQAIEVLEDTKKISVPEFTLTGIEHNSMFAHVWYLGCDEPMDSEEAKRVLDETLCKLNDDYQVERLEAITDVFVKVLPLETFYAFMKQRGKVGGAHKFPRVLKNQIQKDWESFLDMK